MRNGIAIVLVLLSLLLPARAAFAAVPFELDPTAGADYGPYVMPDAGDTKAYGVRTAGGGDVNIDTFFSPSAPKECAGYTDTAPDLALYNSEDTRFVRVFFAGIADSTLVARTGDGSWYCSDDALDTRNPSLDLKNLPASSSVYIWIGSYDGNTRVDGTLYFTTNRAYRVSNPPVGYAAIEQLGNALNAAPDMDPEEPAGASEGLNFVNKTSSTVWLAIGYLTDSAAGSPRAGTSLIRVSLKP